MATLKGSARAVARLRRRVQPERPQSPGGLVALAEQHGVKLSDEDRARIAAYAAELEVRRSSIHHAVVISDIQPVAVANAFGEFLPDAAITLLDASARREENRPAKRPNVRRKRASKLAAAVQALSVCPRPDVILDLSSGGSWSKVEALREFLFFVRDGGLVALADPPGAGSTVPGAGGVPEYLNDLAHRPAGAPERTREADEEQLANAIGRVIRCPGATMVVKAGEHRFKLRDAATNEILAKRYGDAWGSVLHTTAATTFASRATFSGNRNDIAARVCPATITVPELSLRSYRDVCAQPRQILFDQEFFLPDTFRHPRQARLRSRALVDASPTFGVLARSSVTRQVDGTHYYLDTEFPGHFGHVLGEVISRLPGYFRARDLYPDLRVVVSLKDGATGMPEFQRQIFRAAGIADDVEQIRPGETVRFDHLIASTPHYANAGQRWIAPELGETWRYLRDRLPAGSSARPARIFVSRRPGRRSCLNSEQVEEQFAGAGFAILYPEEIPYLDQVDIFAHAEVIAGFGGSGMFNMIFAKQPGIRIVIASANFTCNEYMFSSVLGDEVHCFWQTPQVSRPDRGFSGDAYHSDFEFDFAGDGARLTTLLNSL